MTKPDITEKPFTVQEGKLVCPKLLKRLMRFDHEDGILWWLERTPDMFTSGFRTAEGNCGVWNHRYAGEKAFTSVNGGRYYYGNIFNKKYRAHRVVWALHYGEWPEHQVDHINHNGLDNRVNNLRVVTNQENGKNANISSRNSSGITGVSWSNDRQKWYSYITVDGKMQSLGCYANKGEAASVRKKAEQKHGFHENHGSNLA
jgi:hypothetical protein